LLFGRGWKTPTIGCSDILHNHDSRDILVPTALGHKLYAWSIILCPDFLS